MNNIPKKILFLTGTRADYGKLKPLIEKSENYPEFECHIFITGMHMLSRYGYTFVELQKAGHKNIFPYINQMHSTDAQMDVVLANTIQGLGHYVREFQPDLIVVHGDRVEALAGAVVGALNNIMVAHIEGGEVSGTIDELIRHAISKLSHLHFVANGVARKRLIQMGELPDSIYSIGSPDIDVMLSNRLPTLKETKQRYEISFRQYGVFIYHPVTSELHALRKNIADIMEALRATELNFVIIYPNNDPGSDIIMEAILQVKEHPRFRVIPSLRFEHFLTLLKHAKFIIGNSSAGIREAPVFGVPTINIGSRQMNRFCYPSIINVPEDKTAILHSLDNLPISVIPSTHFGKGNSAEGFMAALNNPNLWETPCQKQFQDVGLIDDNKWIVDSRPVLPKIGIANAEVQAMPL